MVRMLVELIGGPAEAAGDDMDTDEDCRAEAASKAATPESRAMGKAECASVARLLLNTILELFGKPNHPMSVLHTQMWYFTDSKPGAVEANQGGIDRRARH